MTFLVCFSSLFIQTDKRYSYSSCFFSDTHDWLVMHNWQGRTSLPPSLSEDTGQFCTLELPMAMASSGFDLMIGQMLFCWITWEYPLQPVLFCLRNTYLICILCFKHRRGERRKHKKKGQCAEISHVWCIFHIVFPTPRLKFIIVSNNVINLYWKWHFDKLPDKGRCPITHMLPLHIHSKTWHLSK